LPEIFYTAKFIPLILKLKCLLKRNKYILDIMLMLLDDTVISIIPLSLNDRHVELIISGTLHCPKSMASFTE
jgi:hypothetical protein